MQRTGTVRPVEIRALGIDEIDRYRTIRLAALRADPSAFASTYEREQTFDDDTWRARLGGMEGRPGVVLVAVDGERTVGMTGIAHAVTPGDAVLWGMWVDPVARGTGAGGALVGAAVGWARDQGLDAVVLWVVRTNVAAIGLYERSGFAAAPNQAGAPDGSCATELAMRRPL